MKHLDIFSGIGGFALAAESVWPEIEHIFCDNEPFSQEILKKHWPQTEVFSDIRELTSDSYNARCKGSRLLQQGGLGDRRSYKKFYLLTGGFPCQPFSVAGRRKGTQDDRFLWGEMLRVIREFRPRWVVAENVPGLITIGRGLVFEQVCAELEGEGYSVQTFIIPAVAVNAPHRRDRVWIVAHCESRQDYQRKLGSVEKTQPRQKSGNSSAGISHNDATDSPFFIEERAQQKRNKGRRPQGEDRNPDWNEDWTKVAARLCRLDDGLPSGLPRPRGWRNAALKAYGNSIVPQVAAEIFKAIKEVDGFTS